MLDRMLMFAVVIGPTLFAISVELMSEGVRKHWLWRYVVIIFGLSLSALTLWQISRQETSANIAQESAIERVASETSQKVTQTISEQYKGIVSNLTDQIGTLKGQLASQAKDLSVIKGSNIVTGKKPVKVEVTNPTAPSSGEIPLDVHVSKLREATPIPQYGKNAIKFLLTTNKTMNGGRVRVECSKGKINQGAADILNAGVILRGGAGGVLDDHTFVSSIGSPNWSPNFPLTVTLYYDSDDLGECKFTPLQ
ncbi:MAG TPA: hypothetical protein VGT03_08300 [Candidatus Acidoferrales bacterium]|nr:hypothetical protein [Candidatus Acidoferrales bacterium]